jgi:hypothetical protein
VDIVRRQVLRGMACRIVVAYRLGIAMASSQIPHEFWGFFAGNYTIHGLLFGFPALFFSVEL